MREFVYKYGETYPNMFRDRGKIVHLSPHEIKFILVYQRLNQVDARWILWVSRLRGCVIGYTSYIFKYISGKLYVSSIERGFAGSSRSLGNCWVKLKKSLAQRR